MRVLVLFLSVLLLWTATIRPGAAQITTLPVRGGEHALFTRLVIQLPEDNIWRVEARADSATLFIDGSALRFDISQTFARIPRTRLRSLIADDNRLELQLACACEIRASEDIPQFLVIDIVGPTTASAPTLSAAIRPPPRPARRVAEPAARGQTANRAGVALAQNLRGLPSEAGQTLSLTLDPIMPPAAPPSDVAQARIAEGDRSRSMPEMSAELGRVIAHSVAQNMLSPAQTVAPVAAAPPGGDAQDDHILAHITLPPGLAGAPGPGLLGVPPLACQTLAQLDLTSDQGKEFANAPLSASAALYDARDQLARDELVTRARDLLAIGFGAEARAHAGLLDPEDPLAPLIMAMGRIIDDGPAMFGTLSDLQSCGPVGSLWAFLGTGQHALGSDFPYDQVVQAVNALPAELRGVLAPHVVERLLALGRADAAQRVGASLVRLSTNPTVAHQKVQVALSFSDPTVSPDKVLQGMSLQDMPDDVLRMVLAHGELTEEQFDMALLSYAKDRLLALRGAPLGQALAQLVARAFARAGEFEQAFAVAQGRDAALPIADMARLTLELLDMVTANASDGDFIMIVFGQRPWDRADLGAERAAAIAARLKELGFSEQATLVQERAAPRMSWGQDGSEAAETAERDAEAQQLSGGTRPIAAESAMVAAAGFQSGQEDGVDGLSDAQRVAAGLLRAAAERARAAMAEGVAASDSAALTSPDTGQGEARDPLAGSDMQTDLTAASEGPEELSRQTAQLSAPNPNVPNPLSMSGREETSEEQGVLAQTRSLLEASADLRAQLQALLADQPPGVDQP